MSTRILENLFMINIHSDIVGSLLRPKWLLEAQSRMRMGEISTSEFKVLENRAVDESISVQTASGLPVVTDGEMRRQSFQSQMTAAVGGFGEHTLEAFLWGDWHGAAGAGDSRLERPRSLGVVDKLVQHRFLSTEEFIYLRDHTDLIAKVTLPSPSLWANFWSEEHSRAVYPTLDSFLVDVVEILRKEVRELVRLGATYIQLDAPHYTAMIDPATRKFYESRGWSLEKWLSAGIELDNEVIGHFPGVTFGFHL
jgi:5-methyltetrahydropteroyltriglutamate--homocysteine methyltransferase